MSSKISLITRLKRDYNLIKLNNKLLLGASSQFGVGSTSSRSKIFRILHNIYIILPIKRYDRFYKFQISLFQSDSLSAFHRRMSDAVTCDGKGGAGKVEEREGSCIRHPITYSTKHSTEHSREHSTEHSTEHSNVR